jgi:ACS family tartrate transporter-like MFS transporter
VSLAAAVTTTIDPSQTALARVRRRLIPFLFLLYVVAYLDRVNVGFAALEMNRDLGFSSAVYGLGSGIFFVSYTLLEVPSNLMLARVGAGLWIARIMLTWGVVSAAMAFVNSAWMFYLLRFLLGAAEAGFFPGIIYYLTQWFPARERGRAIALFMTGTAIAGVIGGPLSSGLLLLDGIGGLRGWQWLFIVEGVPSVLLAPIVWRRLNEGPATARWLSEAERRSLTELLAADRVAAPGVHGTLGAAFGSPRLWALSAIYFCIVLAIYGVSFWLPQMLQAAGLRSSAMVSLVSALPYAAAAVAMVLVGAHSDRTGERRWHVAWSALAGAAGFALTALAPGSLVVAVAALSLAAMGVWGTLGPFWALPTAFLTGRAAAGGVALVNSVANIAGFAGPTLMGYMRDVTGSFTAGLWLLAGAMTAGAVIVVLLAPAADTGPAVGPGTPPP